MKTEELAQQVAHSIDLMFRGNWVDATVFVEDDLRNIVYLEFPSGEKFELAITDLTIR